MATPCVSPFLPPSTEIVIALVNQCEKNPSPGLSRQHVVDQEVLLLVPNFLHRRKGHKLLHTWDAYRAWIEVLINVQLYIPTVLKFKQMNLSFCFVHRLMSCLIESSLPSRKDSACS